MEYIASYTNALADIMLDMSIYLLVGFLFAGLLHVYFPKDKLVRYLGKRNLTSVVNAAILGVPLPLCSCGVIPTGVSFYKNGASKGASVSFLISTPQTGVDSILVTYSLLGLPFAIIRPIIAFITGIFGGFFTNRVDKEELKSEVVKANDSCAVEYHYGSKLYRMLKYAFSTFLQDIQRWLIIGILLAAVIAVVVPDNFFAEKIDNSLVGMLIMLVAAIPLYVCATASVPIAAVLMLKGLSPGAALVFLMAGPATNIATLTVLGNVFGRKTLIIYLIAIISGALAFGFLIDAFLPAHWFNISMHAAHSHLHFIPYWLQVTSAILLVLLLINGIYQKNKRKIRTFATKRNIPILKLSVKGMDTTTILVDGMTCNHCKSNVEKKLQSLKGIYNVRADVASGEVDLDGLIDIELISEALEDIGYEFKGIKKDGGSKKAASSIKYNKMNIFFSIALMFMVTIASAQDAKQLQTVQISTSAQCIMCKERIENAMIFEKGVKQANLDLQTKVLTVNYRAEKTSPEKLREELNKLGYDADSTYADEKAYQKLPPCCKKPWDSEHKPH